MRIGGIKVNPKRKFTVVRITIGKEGIAFTYSMYKKPSLNSEDIILYLSKVIKDEKFVIAMDNRIHGDKVREFLEEKGVEIVYLHYSPDKSPEGPWILKKKLYSKTYTDIEILTWDAKRFLRSIYRRANDLVYSVRRCEPWTSILNEVVLPFKV